MEIQIYKIKNHKVKEIRYNNLTRNKKKNLILNLMNIKIKMKKFSKLLSKFKEDIEDIKLEEKFNNKG